MKRSIVKLTAVLTLTAILSGNLAVGNSFAAEKILKPGDRYSVSGVNAGKNAYVLQVHNADLNKDNKAERIYVVGNRFSKESAYYDKLTYVISDGKTGKRIVQTLQESGYDIGGYEPKVTILDVDNDGQKDLFLSAPTGGSGGFVTYDIRTFNKGKLTSILSEKDMVGLTVTGKFVDGFKAEFTAKEIERTWQVDVSDRRAVYLESKTYDASGKFIGVEQPYSSNISYIEVVDYGINLLKCRQKLTGIANADTIGYVDLYLQREKGKWVIKAVTQTSYLKDFGSND